MIRAYDLERKEAFYPRVVVSDEVAEDRLYNEAYGSDNLEHEYVPLLAGLGRPRVRQLPLELRGGR